MSNKTKPIHYGERYEVSGFIPPEAMTRIADERTRGMADFFLATASRQGMAWYDQLHRLARSCYMQGVNDSVDSIVKSGMKIVERKDSEQGPMVQNTPDGVDR